MANEGIGIIKSETIEKLAVALIAAQNEMEAVGKNKINPFFKSNYADLANVIEVTRPALCKNGLAVTHVPDGDKVYVILVHSSGQYLGGPMNLRCDKPGPQAQGSAYSYSRRYSYKGIIGAIDTDDDAEAAEDRRTVQPTAPKAPSYGIPIPKFKDVPEPIDPSEHVIKIGKKYVGRRLKELTEKEIKSLIWYLNESPNTAGRKLTMEEEHFLAMANSFLRE